LNGRRSLAGPNQWQDGFLVGQWLLPATVLMEMIAPPLLITAYLWGALLAISMRLAAWGTIQAQ